MRSTVQEPPKRAQLGAAGSSGRSEAREETVSPEGTVSPEEPISPEGAISLHGVSRGYRDRSGTLTEALHDVSFTAAPCTVLAVVGPSGCGKTTLLELVCGLQAPDSGVVNAPAAALMPQRDLLLPWLGALDNAALALRIAGHSKVEARAKAQPLFSELGLSGFERARPGELSGGMRQRVAFLRTLLSGKQALCLDEPFGALDAITRTQMQGWLAQALEREPRTVLLVTHDVEEAVLLADVVIVLSPRPGRVLARIEVPLAHPRQRSDAAVIELRERAFKALGLGAMPNDAPTEADGK